MLFVNYEDFYSDLERYIINTNNAGNYYSGYDCDSLALEPISHFCQFFLPLFRKHPNAMLEIRTKSTQVRGLLEVQALENVIVAMSFASEAATARWEHKVPSLKKRLEALVKLQNNGWPIALRFEPIIYTDTVIEEYESLFKWVFSSLNAAKIHSVSLGEFRMPTEFYKNISKLYPDEALYAQAINVQDGEVSLKDNSGGATIEKLENMLSDFISPTQYYRCA